LEKGEEIFAQVVEFEIYFAIRGKYGIWNIKLERERERTNGFLG